MIATVTYIHCIYFEVSISNPPITEIIYIGSVVTSSLRTAARLPFSVEQTTTATMVFLNNPEKPERFYGST